MKIDFQQPLLGLDGVALQTAGKPFLLLHACQEALTATFPDEQIDATEKIARYAIALKIGTPLPPDLSIEELAKIRSLVGKAYGPIVVGRAYELLDEKPSKVQARSPAAVPLKRASE